MLFDRAALSYVYCAPAGGDSADGSSGVSGIAASAAAAASEAAAPAAPAAGSTPHVQAGRTTSHDTQASRLWKACRKKNGQSENIDPLELADGGAEQLVTELCQFATSQPIPIWFDENLQPTTNSKRSCVASTLVGYLGKYLKHLRTIDRDHPDWANIPHNKYPLWWTSLRQALLDRATANQMKWQGDIEWGVGDTRPLYLDLNAKDGDHPLKCCDLTQNPSETIIMLKLLQNW